MKATTKARLRKGLKITLLVYIAVGTGLYFLQEKFLLHPEKLAADHVFSFKQPFREISLPVNEEKNLSIVQFTVADSSCKGVVLYFHGNRRNIERYAEYAVHFTRNQYEVWMLDYPGFGKTTGPFTEAALYADAKELYRMASSRFGKDSIVVYGKSLGTGIAAQLASVVNCRQLILETPYYSIPSLMRHWAFIYPVDYMAKYQLPTYQFLQKAEVPVTLIHGTGDGIIPYKQAKKLLNENKDNCSLITIEGGSHNDLASFPKFQQALDSLLQH